MRAQVRMPATAHLPRVKLAFTATSLGRVASTSLKLEWVRRAAALLDTQCRRAALKRNLAQPALR
jgi:hypothetical protein